MSQPPTPSDPGQAAPAPPPVLPHAPAKRPIALGYATPPPGTSLWTYNRWWMVLLRIAGGGVAAIICFAIGAFLSGATHIDWLMFVPPAIGFTALTVLLVKYKRFGYLTGFIATPIILAVAFLIFIIVMCASRKP